MQRAVSFFTLLLFTFSHSVNAQAWQVKGTVSDANNEPLSGVNVVVEGRFITGTVTNSKGEYVIRSVGGDNEVTLTFSFVGFMSQRVPLQPGQTTLDIRLEETANAMNEVIISASRIEERVMETPVTVERINSRQIETTASSELLSSLARFKGIDVNQSSLLLSSLSTRGFNSAKSERLIQMVDYADIMAPSLSLYAGNINGAPDIDIESVDVIYGANSALYGANAFNGVVLTNTKDPFLYEGLTLSVRGGNRALTDLNGRLAFKLTDRLAIKLTGSYFKANDFIGRNNSARSTAIEPANNAAGDPRGYDAQHTYGDNPFATSATVVDPVRGVTLGMLGFQGSAFLPGFRETDLVGSDYKASMVRFNGSLHYLIAPRVKASYEFRTGYGGGIYQSSNRYLWDRVNMNTHKLELKSDRWFLRAYRNGDTPGQTYDLNFWGTGMLVEQPYTPGPTPTLTETSVANSIPAAARTYAAVYGRTYLAAFVGARQQGVPVEQAYVAARNAAANIVPRAGDERLPGLIEAGKNNQGLFDPTFRNRSDFWDYSGQYQIPSGFANIIVGGSYRRYTLSSSGTLFSDGQNSPIGESTREEINNYEAGAYGQAQKSLAADRLKLTVAGRLDNFKNFGTRFSPRVSGVYTAGARRQHNFRANYAQAFRQPAQVDQYIRLDIGSLLLLGNVGTGFTALPISNPAGPSYTIRPLRPERMNSWEVGYKGLLFKGFYLDLSYYISNYTDFIGTQRFFGREDGSVPDPRELASPPAATDPTYRNRTRPMQVWLNSDRKVTSQGLVAGIDYYISRQFNLSGNYTYSTISDVPGLILGFNTPGRKFNIGVNGEPIKNLVYSANLRSVSSYNYFMPFDEGQIDGFTTLDAQVSYRFPNLYTTFRLGGTNLTDANAIQVYGSAPIGRIVYAGLTFDTNVFRK